MSESLDFISFTSRSRQQRPTVPPPVNHEKEVNDLLRTDSLGAARLARQKIIGGAMLSNALVKKLLTDTFRAAEVDENLSLFLAEHLMRVRVGNGDLRPFLSRGDRNRLCNQAKNRGHRNTADALSDF